MKSIKDDNVTKAYRVGVNASTVAEAVQTEISRKYVEIITAQKKVKASSVDEAFAEMEKNTMELMQEALGGVSRISNEILGTTSRLFSQSKKEALKITKLDSKDEIKDYLFKITGNQLRANQKVRYKNGRSIGFKEYVEMATRTRMQHQLLEQELEFGELTNQLFYIADTYSDCANDHIDYQGKLYYSEKVFNKIDPKNPKYNDLKSAVKKCKTSVEKVTSSAPYLCTRPNCRHRLIPIAIDDVVEKSNNTILREQKADKGNYSKSAVKRNYDDSQKQRKIELQLRTQKRNMEFLEKAYKESKDEQVLQKLNRTKASIRASQQKMRALVKSNSTLKRDYRRENPYHLQKDLGVAYNTQKVRARVDTPLDEIVDFETSDKSFNEFKKDINLIKKQDGFYESLSVDEKKLIDEYTTTTYDSINKFMYDNEGFKNEVSSSFYNEIKKETEQLHQIFLKLKDAEIKSDKAIVVYRGTDYLLDQNDTTVILNSFTSTSVTKIVAEDFTQKRSVNNGEGSVFKIIIPPESQDQALFLKKNIYNEEEFLIDTNSVYDIIGQENITTTLGGENLSYTEYTMLLRPKHKGVRR